MVLYTIHKHSVQQSYKAHICSKATLYMICAAILTYIPPLFIAYYTHGFWSRESIYQEQAEINFKHEFIVMMQGISPNSLLAYSTYQNLNDLFTSYKRIPFVQSYEEDLNNDGKKDFLDFDLEMPMQDSESINYVQLLLFFDYRLHKFASLRMESMAYIHFSSPLSGSEYSSVGDLRFRQRYLLPSKGSYTTYNTAVVDSSGIQAANYDLSSIFRSYSARNVSTEYISSLPLWKGARAPGSPFKLKVRLHYPEERIRYRPGFFEIIKFAWIQYLSVLFIFLYFFRNFNRGVYKNQVFTTIPQKVMARIDKD